MNVVTGYDPEAAKLASDLNMNIYFCSGAYGISGYEDKDEYKAVDVNGKNQIWFNSSCPNNEQIRQKTINNIDKWADNSDIKGVYIDGARFSSPCSSNDTDSFFTCFCPVCMKKAASLGYDPEKMHNDVLKLYEILKKGSRKNIGYLSGVTDVLSLLTVYKGVFDWFDFKRVCTTEFLLEFSKTVRLKAKTSGIFIFTPSLSCMVGQNYSDLSEHIDIFSPMIYRSYKSKQGPACLNRELESIAGMISCICNNNDSDTLKLLSLLTGLPLENYNGLKELSEGLREDIINVETIKTVELTGNKEKIIPIILLEDNNLLRCISEVEKAGVNKIMFFLYNKSLIERYLV